MIVRKRLMDFRGSAAYAQYLCNHLLLLTAEYIQTADLALNVEHLFANLALLHYHIRSWLAQPQRHKHVSPANRNAGVKLS